MSTITLWTHMFRENAPAPNSTPTKGVRVLPMSPQAPNNQPHPPNNQPHPPNNQPHPPNKQPTPPQGSQGSPGVPRSRSPGVSDYR